MHPDTDGEVDTVDLLQTAIEFTHGIEDAQPRTHGSLRIVFMRVGIAKIDQEPIAQELGNVSVKTLDNFGTRLLIGTHQVTVLFRVEPGGELRGLDQVTEHDRELPTFGFWSLRGGAWNCARNGMLCQAAFLL
jgi:hypothetical protein